jgi:hypothetical protein
MQTNGKTTTIIILCGVLQAIILFGMGILCTGVIANENRNTETHRQMIRERTDMFNQLIMENNKAHTDIIQRLSRIEALIK